MKTIDYKFTNDKTIVEMSFRTIPKKGWFNTNVKPMLDVLKGLVPATLRTYDPVTFKWEFGAEYWSLLSTIFKSHGWHLSEVQDVNEKNNEYFRNIKVDDDFAENFYYNTQPVSTQASAQSIAAQLTDFLGVDVSTKDVNELKKLYRRKALELHPDRNNGDGSKMSELNMLWTLFMASDKVM